MLLRGERKRGMTRRIREHYRRISERDKQFIRSLDVWKLNRWLTILLLSISVFFFLDITSTLFAMATMPGFVERNIVVAPLFDQGYAGFLRALVLKYAPLVPVVVAIVLKPRGTRFEITIKVAKLGVLTGLLAVNLIYAFIIFHNTSILLGR